jgi:TPR repeat protein
MRTDHYAKVLIVAALWQIGLVANAQPAPGIRGVTRRSATSPAIGIQALVPLTNSAPNLAAPAPLVSAPARVPNRTVAKEDPVEVDRRVLAFQRKRAAEGSPSARFDLAKRYLEGTGVAQDLVLGLQWLRSAADAGSSQAAKLLQKLEAKYPEP